MMGKTGSKGQIYIETDECSDWSGYFSVEEYIIGGYDNNVARPELRLSAVIGFHKGSLFQRVC